MGSEWKSYRLEELCDFINGFAFKSTDYVPPFSDTIEVFRMGYIERGGGFKEDNSPVFVPRKYGKNLEKYFLHPGDVTIAMTDMKDRVAILGNTAWIRDAGRFVVNQRVGCMRVKRPDLLEPRFFYFYSNWSPHVDYLRSRANSGVQVNLSTSAIKESELTLPPLAEQKAIAAVLGALDDKIELNRRMNATLEAMARSLFQSWFVDFDPVRRNKDEGGRMKDEISALFPDSFQESPLGLIPKGWEATTLGACIGFRSGFSFKSQNWQESGIPVVKIGSVKPGIIDLSQVSYVSEDIAQQAARYRLGTGDMLIGMTGYVGEVGLIPPSDNPPLLNQRVGKFVMAKPGTESLAFWYCATRQPEFKTFVEARSHGTAQANVSGESIMEFPLVVPRAELLDEFNRKCQPLLDRILANHGESRTLATLRDTLLPKLLSGELSVAGTAA